MLAGLSVEGGPALALARGGADAAVLSSFGSLLCLLFLGPEAGRVLRGIAWGSIGMAGMLTLTWAMLEAAQMGGSPSALPTVLQSTLFGHLILCRVALLGAAAVLLRLRRLGPAAVAAGLAVASQAGHGHALAMWEGPSWLLLSEVLHLLAAGAWLGGLLPLAGYVAAAPAGAAAVASRRFGRLGALCVIVIAGTATFQSLILVGSVAGLAGTTYGLVVLVKITLFLLLLGFAARHRFRLTPALAGPGAGPTKMRLARSIGGETGVGLLVVLAAGLLTSLEPAMHEQPAWPFAWRPTLETVTEDPAFLREAVVAGGAVLAALVMAGIAFLLRWRVRWAVAALAAAVLWLAGPHLDLLFVPAVPTQFWSSPTGFSSASIAEGAALYPQHCAGCHGPRGRGDGPAAGSLSVPPADLTAAHLWAHPDGELFWWLSHGIEGPDGRLAMPGFPDLRESERWALIDWMRANNAGLARLASGDWPFPVQAPGLDLACAEPGPAELADLRGDVVRIVAGPVAAVPGAVTVLLDAAATPGPGLCVGPDPSATAAYKTVTGLSTLRGSEVLVDGEGWLRAVLMDGSPERLAAAVQEIRAQRVAATPPRHAGMKM